MTSKPAKGLNLAYSIGHLKWGFSSAGRAPALQAGGQRFDPANLHQLNVCLFFENCIEKKSSKKSKEFTSKRKFRINLEVADNRSSY